MIKLSKPKKSEPIKLLYTNCDIPAKLFFEIWETGDYTLVGSEDVFYNILDEYVSIDKNDKVVKAYNHHIKIKMILVKMSTIERHLMQITMIPLTDEERLEAIDNINSVAGVKVNFSKDPFKILDEVLRVQSSVLGMLKNQLNMELQNEDKQKENAKYDFIQDLVGIENILERSLDENVSLRKFAHYKQSAKDRVDNLKKLSNNGK